MAERRVSDEDERGRGRQRQEAGQAEIVEEVGPVEAENEDRDEARRLATLRDENKSTTATAGVNEEMGGSEAIRSQDQPPRVLPQPDPRQHMAPQLRGDHLHPQQQQHYHQQPRTSLDMRGMRNVLPYPGAVPIDGQQYHQTQPLPYPTTPNSIGPPNFGHSLHQAHPMTAIQANYAGSLNTTSHPYPHAYHQPLARQQPAFYAYGDNAAAYYPVPSHFPGTPFNTTSNTMFGPQRGYLPQPHRVYPPAMHGTMFAGSSAPIISQGGPNLGARHPSEAGAPSSTLRGPPKKPKQSGYALWCGNLPAETKIAELKDYFSRGATNEISSVFLISKSSCAFINYMTEAACTTALDRFHDTRFRGSKLVCRLRKPAAVSAGTPTSPLVQPTTEVSDGSAVATDDRSAVTHAHEGAAGAHRPHTKTAEKFFVLKSLTVEDLDASVRTGTWATQSHNEATLNAAYQSAESVYLVFSANKSGEYYGYAKMVSTIEDTTEITEESAPRPALSLAAPTDSSITTFTDPTEYAPKGYIIDDSSRGTIFWEADRDDQLEARETDDESNVTDTTESEVGQQTLGRPFQIEWVSTQKVPFHRARGLRNPWNQNREVKIARDGTEIEPSVGRQLAQLFTTFGMHGGTGLPPHMVNADHPLMLPGSSHSTPRFRRPY